MSMSSRDRRAVLIGSVLLGVALLLRFVLLPSYEQWREMREAVVAHEAMLSDVERRLDRRDAMITRLLGKYGDAIEKELLDVDAVRVAFPASIQKALKQSGVNVQSIDVQAVRRVRSVSGVSMISLRVQATCEPNAVGKMIEKLTHTEQITVIERLDVTMEKSGQRNKWAVGLVVATPALEDRRS